MQTLFQELVGVLSRNASIYSIFISGKAGQPLSLLVENQGHINFLNMTYDLKVRKKTTFKVCRRLIRTLQSLDKISYKMHLEYFDTKQSDEWFTHWQQCDFWLLYKIKTWHACTFRKVTDRKMNSSWQSILISLGRQWEGAWGLLRQRCFPKLFLRWLS